MRGTDHSRDEHAFVISRAGIEVFPPRVIIQREQRGGPVPRLRTRISKLETSSATASLSARAFS